MLIDSHCHLDFPQFSNELEEIIMRSKKAGVRAIVTISTKIANFSNILAITERFENVFCSVGTHPHNAADEFERKITTDEIIKLAENKKTIAIGEAGLDYHYGTKQEVGVWQTSGLIKHIEVARQTQLPLVIHSRSADDDMINILTNEMKKGVFPAVLHCFSSGEKLARVGIELGFYISFSGILTFKNGDNLRKLAANLPKDRVLVETDSPYLAPVPHRGKTNEPSFVIHTAEKLSNVWNMSVGEVYDITGKNFLRLFNKAVIV